MGGDGQTMCIEKTLKSRVTGKMRAILLDGGVA